jgi:hypothetical protein
VSGAGWRRLLFVNFLGVISLGVWIRSIFSGWELISELHLCRVKNESSGVNNWLGSVLRESNSISYEATKQIQ